MRDADTITISEAARVLGMSSAGVKGLVTRGDLPCTVISNGWRLFRRSDVEALAAFRRDALPRPREQ